MTGSMYVPGPGMTTGRGPARVVGAREGGDLLARPEQAHTVHFYRDDATLRDAVSRFVLAGLVAGEPIVVIATSEHWTSFVAEIADRGFDVERALAAGRLTLLDARATLDALLVDGVPDRDRFLRAVGGALDGVRARHAGRPIRAYGEMVDLLWRDGAAAAALQLEALWNELALRHAFSLFCAYAVGDVHGVDGGAEFAAVRSAHSHVVPADTGADADQASRAKDDFLAMLGHELRNPLSPILTAVQLMKLRGDGSARERDVIERQVKHLIRLVDDLLGQVTAHGDGPGRGSELVAQLPALAAAPAAPSAAPERRARSHLAEPRRVLVVDDNQDAAALLGELLQSVGHDVRVAHDGPNALALAAGWEPDIAILDIGLPVMDGYELAAALRVRLGTALRLMAVTGYGQDRDRLRARAAGFDAHFVKPVPLAAVLGEIDRINRSSSSPPAPADRTAPA